MKLYTMTKFILHERIVHISLFEQISSLSMPPESFYNRTKHALLRNRNACRKPFEVFQN